MDSHIRPTPPTYRDRMKSAVCWVVLAMQMLYGDYFCLKILFCLKYSPHRPLLDRPLLEYCSCVWSVTLVNDLESVQCRFNKRLLGFKSTIATMIVVLAWELTVWNFVDYALI